MKERPTNGQVIIVFTEHPILGILLIPYIAGKAGRWYLAIGRTSISRLSRSYEQDE